MALGTVTGMTPSALLDNPSDNPSDNLAQQCVVSDFQTTFLLEAGAGTGKTQLLLSRLLALLRTGRSPLSRIAVITFTEKAAAELRTRLRTTVESALQTSLPEAERTALQSVLPQLDRAMVMTIHALCAALLRERALEVGLDPAFTVLNQAQTGLLHDQVWHAWLTQELQGLNASSDLIRRAFRAGLSVSHLKSLCDFLVEQRDCMAWLPASVASRIPIYCAEIHAAVARLTTLQDCCQDATDNAFEQITSLIDIVPTADYQDNEAAWQHFLFHRLTVQPRKGRQTNWQPTAALHEARTLLTQIKDLHLKARAAWLHDLTVGLAGWLGGYLRAYQAKKQQQGCLDFLDLLVLMRNGLKQNRELRRYFQRKFDFLLVDEVQDTDPLQAEILFFLAEDQPQTDGWTQVALRAGKLFLVGDPQQSIYRFRRADLEIYHLLRSAIQRQGQILALSTNFRMRAALVKWMNDTFSRVLDNADDPDQPGYLPLRAVSSEDQEGQEGPTVFLLDLPQSEPHEQANQANQANQVNQVNQVNLNVRRNTEARCTVRFIREIVEHKTLATQGGQPLTYSDMAILCRTNRSVEIYERALRDAQIPYRSTGTRRVASSQEQTDIQACVRTLLHPADATAMVATLRSALFGFSDEELAQFRCAGGAFDYLSGRVPAQLACADRFHAAFALLRTLHQSHTAQSAQGAGAGLSSLLSEIYTHTPLLPLFAQRPHGPQRVRHLLQLVEALRGISDGDAGDFSTDFLDRLLTSTLDESELGESLAESGQGQLAAEQDNTLDDLHDALHVLTIHKAKGLEFPLVIVAESGAQSNRLTRMGLVSRKDARLELHVGPRNLNCCTLGWQEAEVRERNREAAEERRLWYVAATRAREYVVFPLHPPSDAKKGDTVLHTVLRAISAETRHTAQHGVIIAPSRPDQPQVLPDPAGFQEKEAASAVPEPPIFSVSPVSSGLERDAAQYSDIADIADIVWITERRRLIAKGRRKRQTQRVIRRENVSWRQAQQAQQAQLDRLITQTALQLRQEKDLGVPLQVQSSAKYMHASGGPFTDDVQQYIARAAIWPRMQVAPKCLVNEVFALHSGPSVLTGRIPLAFLEGEKWFIADFFLGEAYLSGKEHDLTYEMLGPGALALEQLTPFPVQELLLFLVNRQQEICVRWEGHGKGSVQEQLLEQK